MTIDNLKETMARILEALKDGPMSKHGLGGTLGLKKIDVDACIAYGMSNGSIASCLGPNGSKKRHLYRLATQDEPTQNDSEQEEASQNGSEAPMMLARTQDGWNMYHTDPTSKDYLLEDEEVARRAGLARPRNIRNVIKANEATLREFGPLEQRSRQERYEIRPGVYNTNTVDHYYLNREQVVWLLFQLRTEQAMQVQFEVIRIYFKVLDGEIQPMQFDPSAIIGKLQLAIAPAVERFTASLVAALDRNKQEVTDFISTSHDEILAEVRRLRPAKVPSPTDKIVLYFGKSTPNGEQKQIAYIRSNGYKVEQRDINEPPFISDYAAYDLVILAGDEGSDEARINIKRRCDKDGATIRTVYKNMQAGWDTVFKVLGICRRAHETQAQS